MSMPLDDTTIIDQDKYKGTATMVYALYALSFLFAITVIFGVIIAHLKKGDAEGSYVQSHFSYQIRTFWWSVVWVIVGIATIAVFFIGYLVLIANAIWFIYRIIKGWMRLSEKSAI
jgi:uncharacterized membrane protein